MPLLDGLRVGHSKIHGYGIFTTRPFATGERLLFGDGVLWREDDDFDDTYALITPGYENNADGTEGPPLFWDLADQSRWINHSCAPNSEVDTRWVPGEDRIEAWWTATRDIGLGEEICYDYAFSADVAEPCGCGASTCRGLIVDLDEIAQVPPDRQKHLRLPVVFRPSL